MENLAMAISYIAGTVLSAIAGKIGIMVAALSNARCAEGAQKGIKPAFLIGFRGGAVMGLLVVGCSLLGVAAILMLFGNASINTQITVVSLVSSLLSTLFVAFSVFG